jgi:hypothetical protein
MNSMVFRCRLDREPPGQRVDAEARSLARNILLGGVEHVA